MHPRLSRAFSNPGPNPSQVLFLPSSSRWPSQDNAEAHSPLPSSLLKTDALVPFSVKSVTCSLNTSSLRLPLRSQFTEDQHFSGAKNRWMGQLEVRSTFLRLLRAIEWETLAGRRKKWQAAEARDGCELALGVRPTLPLLPLLHTPCVETGHNKRPLIRAWSPFPKPMKVSGFVSTSLLLWGLCPIFIELRSIIL